MPYEPRMHCTSVHGMCVPGSIASAAQLPLEQTLPLPQLALDVHPPLLLPTQEHVVGSHVWPDAHCAEQAVTLHIVVAHAQVVGSHCWPADEHICEQAAMSQVVDDTHIDVATLQVWPAAQSIWLEQPATHCVPFAQTSPAGQSLFEPHPCGGLVQSPDTQTSPVGQS